MTKFCKDCKYYTHNEFDGSSIYTIPVEKWDAYIHQCNYIIKKDEPDLVTGDIKAHYPESAKAFRKLDEKGETCGPDAKYFEPKPPEPPKAAPKPEPWYMKVEMRREKSYWNKPWYQFW